MVKLSEQWAKEVAAEYQGCERLLLKMAGKNGRMAQVL
jgi:hypothetical protein